ncbi:arabinose isomerase [Acidobacteria bacterium AB60]|nr:arabinose isomerase [Acidobacteria bacterium AB60]
MALCGIGLDAYWPQFPDLRSRLEGYLGQIYERLRSSGDTVESLGLIDTPQRARDAASSCRRADVDLLIIHVSTYALSSTIVPLVRKVAAPVLFLSLQPGDAIDYPAFNRLPDRTAMTGEWLAWCSPCPLPEIANVLSRARIPFHQVVGTLASSTAWSEIQDWIKAVRVKKSLEENNLGLMGHYYSGMLDIATDIAAISVRFGTHIEHLEIDELTSLRERASQAEIDSRVQAFREHFEVQQDCTSDELARAARTSVALDHLVSAHGLGSLAYYAKGTGVAANEDTMSSIILAASLLTARGIPTAGEYEIKNVLAMKIMDCLGAGGSFTEFYALDLEADHVLMGHDGPGHIDIAETKTRVRPLNVYHGKVGRGLSVEMSVRHGPVTLLSVAEDPIAGFKFLIAEGECVQGEVLQIGNTNSHYRFPIGAKAFVERWAAQGPAHHCAIGVGHLAPVLSKCASLLDLPFVQVC